MTEFVAARVTHHFNQSAAQLFDAWLDVGMIGKFMFGPHLRDERIVSLRLDPRVGGEYAFVIERQGRHYDHVGQYLRLERAQHLDFTWGVLQDGSSSKVRITFSPRDSGCEVALTHEMAPAWANFVERAQQAWLKMLIELDKALS